MKSFTNKFLFVSIFSFSVFSLFASPNFEVDENGDTELHKAAKELNISKVRLILARYKNKLAEDEFKIFVNCRNIKDKGKTALHYLAELAIEAEGFFTTDVDKEVDEEIYSTESCENYPKIDDLKKNLEIIQLLIANGADVFVWSYQQRECPINVFNAKNICDYDGSNVFEKIRDLLWANYSIRRIMTGYCIIS